MKAKEELNVLKEEVETLNKKLQELTEEELVQVTGGKENSTGIDTQISAICIGVSDKNGSKIADSNSIMDSFTEKGVNGDGSV